MINLRFYDKIYINRSFETLIDIDKRTIRIVCSEYDLSCSYARVTRPVVISLLFSFIGNNNQVLNARCTFSS